MIMDGRVFIYDIFRKKSSQSFLCSHLAKSDLDKLIDNLQSKVNPSCAGFEETRAEYKNLVASMNVDSGAWLKAGMINKRFIMNNDEFAAALCRRNTFECNIVPRLSVALAGDSEQSLTCRCDRVVKPIDPFGYHMVGCEIGANAIRLHDEVAFTLANLFRSIIIGPVVEPVRLFDADPDLDDRRRPDILIRNPRGFDR